MGGGTGGRWAGSRERGGGGQWGKGRMLSGQWGKSRGWAMGKGGGAVGRGVGRRGTEEKKVSLLHNPLLAFFLLFHLTQLTRASMN